MSRLEFKRSAIKLRSFLTSEEFEAQDILRFGKKIQITKLPRISPDDKQDIRKKITELEKNLSLGKIKQKDVKEVKARVKKLKEILKKGVIPLFELKFQELQEQIKKGNIVSIEKLKLLSDRLNTIFAVKNIVFLDTLGVKDLEDVLIGLKQLRVFKDWRKHKVLARAQAENGVTLLITGKQYNDPNADPNLLPQSMVNALINHDKITNLQNTDGSLSIDKPIWVFIRKRFTPAPLSRLVGIEDKLDYYLDHRAIIDSRWDISETGRPFEFEEEETKEEKERLRQIQARFALLAEREAEVTAEFDDGLIELDEFNLRFDIIIADLAELELIKEEGRDVPPLLEEGPAL